MLLPETQSSFVKLVETCFCLLEMYVYAHTHFPLMSMYTLCMDIREN